MVINGIKIYSLEYIMNQELTDDDLDHLLNSPSLLYSVIVGMYKYVNSKKSLLNIIKDTRKNNKWLNDHKWNPYERNKFEHKIAKAYQNIYVISYDTAIANAQNLMIRYGFPTK